MLNFYLLRWLLFIAIAQGESSITYKDGCSFSKYCTPQGWCENFTSLVELNSTLSGNASCNYFQQNNNFYSNPISIKANNYKGPLNDRFDYQLFVKKAFPNGHVEFKFHGFNGIDFNLSSIQKEYYGLTFDFHFSQFSLFYNGEKVDASSCDQVSNKTGRDLFRAVDGLNVYFDPNSPNWFYDKWCATAFNNFPYGSLNTWDKPIRFYPTLPDQSKVNSLIQDLSFYEMAFDLLSKEILHPQVHAIVSNFFISGMIKKLEVDVFKDLTSLTYLNLGIYDLKGFIHGNGIEWMNYLNYYQTPNNASLFSLNCDLKCINALSSSIAWTEFFLPYVGVIFPAEYFPNAQVYTFPEDDFCIFASYPQRKSILTTVAFNLANRTCPMIWIYRNLALLAKHNYSIVSLEMNSLKMPYLTLVGDLVEFEQVFNTCNFTDKFEKCQLIKASLNQSLKSYEDSYFVFYDLQSVLRETVQFMQKYFDSWVLGLGFVTNLITLLVILNAHKKSHLYSSIKDNRLGSVKENFFTYMLINAVINCIYCSIMFFNTILPCLPTPVGEKYERNTCLVTTVSISTTASILKLMANVTYLQMSLNRYLLVGKDHSEWLIKLAKANIAILMVISFIFSCLLSYIVVEQEDLFKLFLIWDGQLEYNEYYYDTKAYGGSLIINKNSYFSWNKIDTFLSNNLLRIISLSTLHDFFSYFLFCVMNLVVDVMTVKKLKEALDEKARLSSGSKEKKEEQEKAEARCIVMVVLNSLANILFRVPELIAIVFFYIINSNRFIYRLMCLNFRECDSMTQISNSFYNFTMIFNIFFYYFFNKTFKFAFHLLFSLKPKSL